MSTNRLTASTDVAMFVDWENMHGYIRGKANVSALREVAEGYGRLVLARAYADWREHRFQRDSQVLYQIGFEPVYVPTGYKNNADVKLTSDCIDFAYRHPNIEIFILVSGDGDFIHVVNTLRPLGKKVIVVAQSSNASGRLGDLVDTLLIYDKDVEPAKTVKPTKRERSENTSPKDLQRVFDETVKILRQEEGSPVLLTHMKGKLIKVFGRFDQRDYSFEKFKAMMEEGEAQNYFTIHTAGLRDWLTLPRTTNIANNTGYKEMPNELEEAFQEVREIIKTSNHKKTLLSYLKNELKKKYGGFDESVYGYERFKHLMEDGERLGYFTLGIDENQADYAVVTTNPSLFD